MQQTPLPSEQSIQDVRGVINSSVLPGTTIASIALLPNQGLRRVYEVQLSDETKALVIQSPHPMSRLLRFEQTMTITEAIIIRWLREAVSSPASEPAISLPRASIQASPTTGSQSKQDVVFSEKANTAPGISEHSPVSSYYATNLLDVIPTPFPPSPLLPTKYGPRSSDTPTSTSFTVFAPPPGVPISTLSTPLTLEEQMAVDYQAGKLVRQLSRLTPASGKFGPALAVLAPPAECDSVRGDDGTSGMGTWSLAFQSILESILRDGEDVAVALAYPTIRKHFQRLSHILDTVVTPCLVLVNILDDTNLLVERLSTPGGKPNMASPSVAAQQARQATTTEASAKLDEQTSPGYFSGISLTGVRDWSNCLFGDPLFASVFCEQPSEPFLFGFSSPMAETETAQWQKEPWMSVESRENRAARLLLYQCYHAVVEIVKGFYRPGRDQTTHELAARKRLTEILTKLDTVQEIPRRGLQHRRPSGEMSPAKKSKPNSGVHP